jgi:hypothetical protein
MHSPEKGSSEEVYPEWYVPSDDRAVRPEGDEAIEASRLFDVIEDVRAVIFEEGLTTDNSRLLVGLTHVIGYGDSFMENAQDTSILQSMRVVTDYARAVARIVGLPTQYQN